MSEEIVLLLISEITPVDWGMQRFSARKSRAEPKRFVYRSHTGRQCQECICCLFLEPPFPKEFVI
uniref:Uncharacterized protein n=1 Tax=Anguilla anguilla TaxID=7936 RepID=A0A0E9WP88_ANGAN